VTKGKHKDIFQKVFT